MFYQNNNDYMRDAFYYSQPQNGTYQYNGMNNYMPMGNMQNFQNGVMNQNINPFMNNMNPYSQQNSLENMYPQVYRIIDPVAQRVISNNAYQYYTEDNLNNMVDTVFNIVEGDVSTLSSSTTQMTSDDTVTQGPSRNATQSNGNNRQVNSTETTRTTNTVTVQTTSNDNQLLKDLIKIIIIKELLSRQSNNSNMNCCRNNMNFNSQNYYNPNY